MGLVRSCNNTTGDENTAIGVQALSSNTNGIVNTATGSQALDNNTDGTSNTAIGVDALHDNTTGGGNTAHGYHTLLTTTPATTTRPSVFVPWVASLPAATRLGRSAGTSVTTADHVICIGSAWCERKQQLLYRQIFGVNLVSDAIPVFHQFSGTARHDQFFAAV